MDNNDRYKSFATRAGAHPAGKVHPRMRAYPLGGMPSLSQPNKTHPRALASSRMEKKDFRVDAKNKKRSSRISKKN